MNKAIFKENIRRFWPISFAAFIAYFMCGPFYLLQTRSDASYGFLSSAVSTSNIGYCFVTCAMTVAAAAAVYAYLFKVNSTVFMHAAPASRKDLFLSNAVSGLFLSFIPVMANALVLIVIKLSGKFDGYFRSGAEWRTAEMWHIKGILCWMIVVMVEIFFIFAICTLSAMISGSAVINVLTSCGLNLLTTFIYLSAISYGSCFLFGFVEGSMNEEIMCKLHPVLNYGTNRLADGEFDPGLIIYVLVAAAIFAISYWIYTRRPNEKAGDSYVFDIVDVVICVLMVYMGASCIGLIFEDSMGLWGFVIGGVFSFFVGQLIIQKSFRIFNRRMVVAFITSVIVMAIVIAGFAVDLFGIERRIPDADDVESIKIWDSNTYGGYYYFKDPQNIAEITRFHGRIVESKDELLELYDYSTADENEPIELRYYEIIYILKNGKTIERSYLLSDRFVDAEGNFEDLYRSNEVMSIFDSMRNADSQNVQITLQLHGQETASYVVEDDVDDSGKGIAVIGYISEFSDEYGQYYGMSDFSAEEKTAILEAFCSDIERVGLRKIDPFNTTGFCYLTIRIIHPLDVYDDYASGRIESSNNFRNFWYVYDENGMTNGVAEEFHLRVDEEFTDTVNVIESIFSERFN